MSVTALSPGDEKIAHGPLLIAHWNSCPQLRAGDFLLVV